MSLYELEFESENDKVFARTGNRTREPRLEAHGSICQATTSPQSSWCFDNMVDKEREMEERWEEGTVFIKWTSQMLSQSLVLEQYALGIMWRAHTRGGNLCDKGLNPECSKLSQAL